MKLKELCNYCQKQLDTVSESFLSEEIGYLVESKCGHSQIVPSIKPVEILDIQFHALNEDQEAYEYQKEGIKFLANGGFNGLLGDAMGLGKTVQAGLAYREYVRQCKVKNIKPETVLVVQKSATTYQWIRHWHSWVDNAANAIYPIVGSKGFVPIGFNAYIISMDTLSRKGMVEKLLGLKIGFVIIDECHSFKDPEASRTIALLSLITKGAIKHKILLSGTPIKNRANEYFVSLNIIAPQHFAYKANFERRWLVPNEKGVYTRLAPWRIDEFKQLTSRWILRREKTEVLLDLPDFSRNFTYIEVDDPQIKNSYNKQLKAFRFDFEQGDMNTIQMLGALARLRHITGIGKVPFTIDAAIEFLENTEDTEKLAIGVHHEGVRDNIFMALQKYQCLKLSGEDSAQRKDWLVNEFSNNPTRRVMIMNMLAGGIGLNLQACANCLNVERQWSPADEEQFESRFHRNGQKKAVVADYIIARGTIDEWFHDMVEEKRQIFGETIQGWDLQGDENSIRSLAEKTISKEWQ